MEPIKKIIKQTSIQINREREVFASTLEITGVQLTVLDFISNQKKMSASQHAIEEELGLRRSTITVMIQRMEKRGLVRRVISEQDKRQKEVSLTDKSKDLIPKIKEYMKQDDQKIQNHFTQDEIETTLKVLEYIKNE